jgi:hypothetical protein
VNRITSNFPEKLSSGSRAGSPAPYGRVTRRVGSHPDYQCGSPYNKNMKINSLREKWFYQNPLNQKFSKDVVDNLHKIICQATTHKSIQGQNKLLGLERRRWTRKNKRQRFNPKFTSTKEATSLLRFPQREGYHEEPLVSPLTKEDWCSLRNLHKRWVIQTFPGAPHGECTQRATPNHLEAIFKSNKRESMKQSRHKCFLRWTHKELSQRGLISYLKCPSHPNPRLNPC